MVDDNSSTTNGTGDGRGKGRGSGWGRLLSRLERQGDGDDVSELLPGIVIRDGRIAPGPSAKDPSTWVELAKFVLAAGKLLYAVMKDVRVPLRGKLVAGAAAAYAVSPVDVVPDVIPTAGYIDDVVIVVGALRYLADLAGPGVLREHWTGSDEGFALLMGLVGRD